MSFTNLAIELSTLPDLEDLAFRELAPAYARLQLGIAIATCALLYPVPLIVLWLTSTGAGLAWVISVAGLALVALITMHSWFAARAMRFVLREHDLVFESGVVFKSLMIQPLTRVQHVEITRGPIDKRYGLASVRLFSAGSKTATFAIPGLLLGDAEAIREFALGHGQPA